MVHAYCHEGGTRSPALAVASISCMSCRGLPQVPTSRGDCAGEAVDDDAGEDSDDDPAVRRPRSGGSPSADMLMLTNGGMSSAQGSSLPSISRSPADSCPAWAAFSRPMVFIVSRQKKRKGTQDSLPRVFQRGL